MGSTIPLVFTEDPKILEKALYKQKLKWEKLIKKLKRTQND